MASSATPTYAQDVRAPSAIGSTVSARSSGSPYFVVKTGPVTTAGVDQLRRRFHAALRKAGITRL